MSEIAVLDKNFNRKESFSTSVDLSPEIIKVPVVHQVVKATLAGRRQGTAATKNKALVSGGGSKPFKQKGTGRARQGSSRSPLSVGGGTMFGPQPRSFKQKLNKKIVNIGIKSVLADKLKEGNLHVVEKLESNGKTKELFMSLSGKGLLPALVVTDSKDSLALRAVKNIANAKSMAVEGFSVYEAVKYKNLIIEKAALEKLLNRLV